MYLGTQIVIMHPIEVNCSTVLLKTLIIQTSALGPSYLITYMYMQLFLAPDCS